jgi:putative pyruvate formate lyase activating enzyme
MGEEPPISGRNGSGTVFFSGCPLRCAFCQNLQISHEGLGDSWTVDGVLARISALCRDRSIHNVNLVTPDHFLPHVLAAVELMRTRGVHVPIVYNLSGYQRIETLRMVEGCADIYMPDFKYSDGSVADRLARCPDYPAVALDAIAEMVRQKGFLDCFSGEHGETIECDAREDVVEPARTGVLARHLILPGQVQNSLDCLTMLFVEFGRDLPLSLMSQYVPVRSFPDDPSLNRPINLGEFQAVFDHVVDLGFRNLFVQSPEGLAYAPRPFLPDFRRLHPFEGNVEGHCLANGATENPPRGSLRQQPNIEIPGPD